jgi:hypothetical protein
MGLTYGGGLPPSMGGLNRNGVEINENLLSDCLFPTETSASIIHPLTTLGVPALCYHVSTLGSRW